MPKWHAGSGPRVQVCTSREKQLPVCLPAQYMYFKVIVQVVIECISVSFHLVLNPIISNLQPHRDCPVLGPPCCRHPPETMSTRQIAPEQQVKGLPFFNGNYFKLSHLCGKQHRRNYGPFRLNSGIVCQRLSVPCKLHGTVYAIEQHFMHVSIILLKIPPSFQRVNHRGSAASQENSDV